MKLVGIEGLTAGELNSELQRGAKFVSYQYCVSLLFVTFRHFSDTYFVRTGEKRLGTMSGYIAISLLLGWWGIPWGPIYTIQSLVTNLRGGKDLTGEVTAALNKGGK
jgi:hypothetical protein